MDTTTVVVVVVLIGAITVMALLWYKAKQEADARNGLLDFGKDLLGSYLGGSKL